MTKNKNTKNSKTVGVLLLLILVLAVAFISTYSKYTTLRTGTGTAAIAKWNIDFANGQTKLENNFTVDLAKTIITSDKANNFIQPGSEGEFTITVTNNSQVPAKISAAVSDNSATIFKNNQFTLSVAGNDEETIEAGNSKDVTITWKWDYEAQENKDTVDAADTTLGENSDGLTAKTICGITLTATQVTPTK